MAQDQVEITCPIGGWTLLTDAAVTALTVQPLRGDVYLRGTVGAVTPTEERGLFYPQTLGELQKDIASLFYAAGIDRVYAKPTGSQAAIVLVDHA